jgi:hypothetical protein
VGALQAAELRNEDLRSSHLETVDNVNDLHAWCIGDALSNEVNGVDRRLESNVHESAVRGNLPNVVAVSLLAASAIDGFHESEEAVYAG